MDGAEPYYVIETEPAITFSFHGIRIDDRARALRPDGAPLPGLAAALVFGLTAAETAAS